MLAIGIAAATALAVWWMTTGLILMLDSQPRRTFRTSMGAASGVLGAALFGIAYLRNDVSSTGAYLGFGCGIAVWGWLEMSFLMGYLTGPRRHACSAACGGWRHFVHAIQAILYHELAIIALTGAAFALSAAGPNRIAAHAILLLWAMRVSTKLNLFFGVRNPGTELLPANLAYLAGFFRRRPINFLFPFSVTAATLATGILAGRLFNAGTELATVSTALLATLSGLGVLEHWMLVLPFSTTRLWSWSLRARQAHGA